MNFLEPVPMTEGVKSRGESDEYWLPDGEDGALKLDLHDDKYTISWYTSALPREFLDAVHSSLSGTGGDKLVTISSDGGDYVSVLQDYSLDLSDEGDYVSVIQGYSLNPSDFPEDPGIVKYELKTDNRHNLEIDWFDYPASPHVSVTAADFRLEGRLRAIFNETVDEGLAKDVDITMAYAEAIERAQNRLDH